ncbi:hypothetical protein [Actinomadura coerulea]|uniref:hypothetical protein n=1 Tax=Actinomadura coerulea TaxID=46159 RepID=UPI00341B93AA
MSSMMTTPAPVVGGAVVGIDVAPLAWALERMTPALWVPAPGESPEEAEARRLAAEDILDDLLNEYTADEYAGAVA